MTFDKKIAAMLIAPLIGLVIPVTLFFRKLPTPRLTPSEKELIAFSSQPVLVSQSGKITVYSGLQCPLRPPVVIKDTGAKTGGKNFPPGPIPPFGSAASLKAGQAVMAEELPGVSMIYSDGEARIAIIDGHVLREGSTLNDKKLIKIEKTRVLLRRTDGKGIWLYIND